MRKTEEELRKEIAELEAQLADLKIKLEAKVRAANYMRLK